MRSLFPASCLAATKRQSITSSRACPLAEVRLIRLTFTCLSKPCPLEASDIPALVTTTARPGLTPSPMRNRFSFRRPTWPSSTCSRRIRRKRSKRSASGLNTRPQRSPTKATPKEHRDERERERLRIDRPTVLHCLRCPRRRWHARSLRRWRTGTICPIRPRKRRADPWWHRCYLARVSECRSELSSQSDRADPYRREYSRDPS